MSNFKKGDKVIALSNPPELRTQPRQKGNVYFVEAILYCSDCGSQMINIGPKVDDGVTEVNCASCNTEQNNRGLMWTISSQFRKADEEGIQAAIEECLENEDYEGAAILRDVELETI